MGGLLLTINTKGEAKYIVIENVYRPGVSSGFGAEPGLANFLIAMPGTRLAAHVCGSRKPRWRRAPAESCQPGWPLTGVTIKSRNAWRFI